MTDFKTSIDAIQHVFSPLEDKHLLDIGCGRGRLSRALIRRGARMSGVDPSDEMIALAREMAPEAAFEIAGAEALPYADSSFDGAVILNSLHHIPETKVQPALAEAMRVTRPGGTFLVLEPLARGGYQKVFEPLDDETEVRAMALRELDAFIAATGTEVILRTEFDTMVPEESADTVLAYAAKVDPSRVEKIEQVRAEVSRRFGEYVTQTERGPALDQPMIAVALRRG